MMEYPKLRYGLEAFPVEHEGQRMVLLRDRIGFCQAPLLVSPLVAELLMQMNGKNSLRDLQAHYTRRTGELLFSEKLEVILRMLDEHLFLENENFIKRAGEEVARFRQDPLRRMQHAGKSYPADAKSLSQQLQGFFDLGCGGPGVPAIGSDNRRLLGLVAPHIDIQAGGPCFAHAYKTLQEAAHPDIWVILGTGHEPLDNYFALTNKDFETPFGVVHHDRELCEELVRRAPRDILASEYNHHREHTIEFQAVFLAFSQPESRIVPLLCSFSLEDWDSDRGYLDEMAAIFTGLGATEERRVGFIASVDLAHIGPRYGDNFQPDRVTLKQHTSADLDLLQSVENCDSQKFIGILRREQNRRRICGLGPLYVLAKILEGKAQGSLLQHSHAMVDQQGSFVTFASMAFYAS